jgi:arylsulfatase A-like enzyme
VFTFDTYPEQGFFPRHPTLYPIVRAYRPEWIGRRPFDNTRGLTKRAREALRQIRNEPFFMWVHLMDPHAPYDPPAAYRNGRTEWPYFPPLESGDGEAFANTLDQPQQADVRGLYEGEIRYVDEAIGTLLKTLETLGLADSTFVCFTSDHGEELFDHENWGHGHTLYEEQIRVPLVFAGPGVQRQTIDTPVSAIDLLPTLAGLIGLGASPEWQGTNLAPALRGRATVAPRPVFAQATDLTRQKDPLQAVVVGDLKLIRNLVTGERLLFDLEADPGERTNVAAMRADDADALSAQLDAWQTTFPSTFDAVPVFMETARNHPLTAENREILRGLGYVD